MLKLLSLFVLCLNALAQDVAFPESANQRLDSENKFERVPLYAPNKCPENQLLYPGDQKADWVCDCGPTYIYFPPTDKCYAVYRQGPCKRGEHLVLLAKHKIPECVENPCKEGFARYKEQCYELGKPGGPCAPVAHGGGLFDVNATTLALECLKGTDTLSLFDIPMNCPPGSKRDMNNKCRQIY